jgi:bacterioferritin
MASAKLLDMMNEAIARELQVSVQYMWQHVQWKAVEHYAVTEEFKKIAIAEMKHAEKIAERLWYLGGKPTTKPTMYKEIVNIALKEGDVATRKIFEDIELEEEEHHDFFQSVLEK